MEWSIVESVTMKVRHKDKGIFSNVEPAHKLYIINIIEVIKSLNTIYIFETMINIIEVDLTWVRWDLTGEGRFPTVAWLTCCSSAGDEIW